MVTTDPSPLKVLTAELSRDLRTFNAAARELQRLGVRISGFFPKDKRLQIEAADGRRLLAEYRTNGGYTRDASAGSDRYTVQFRGVTLEWREPITTQPITLH